MGDLKLRFTEQGPLPDSLPTYGSPPVIETSLGIQFEGLTSYTSLAAADFRNMVKHEFPLVEEHSPLDHAFETFGPSDSNISDQRIQAADGAISPRFFFIAGTGTELIQLQKDRLYYNWRQTKRHEPYPRHEYVRGKLNQQLDNLQRWASEFELGEVIPNQCEAAYINRIPLHDIEGKQCGLTHVFRWPQGLEGTTEDGSFFYRRKLLEESGEAVARLFFYLRYGTDSAGEREAQLVLVVRGKPRDTSKTSCLEFLDAAREVIVHTFTQATSDAAHKMWEREV